MAHWERPERPCDQITITEDRVCYGCGCWRDLRGTLRDREGRQGERRRGRGCYRGIHKRLSLWPNGRIPYRSYGSATPRDLVHDQRG